MIIKISSIYTVTLAVTLAADIAIRQLRLLADLSLLNPTHDLLYAEF